ncbi:MAG: YbaB/EbfC family nucleoid-associated protein [Candidatus Margulisbacteria bacterium]|jgi:DNA-binding protein YbaB|nr:YbaB/EbfC family nucleoid-associated protein [Candidatus Margulisiibacteriota bacterium]
MNMFGNLGKMGEMIKQAKQLHEELKQARFEVNHDGVRVVCNGEMEIIELVVPEPVKPQSIKEAVNRAVKTARDEMGKRMQKFTGGLGGLLPGM